MNTKYIVNDKAKPAEKQRRKATGLSFGFEDSRVANREILSATRLFF